MPVIIDSGIDMFKALALGAKAVAIGASGAAGDGRRRRARRHVRRRADIHAPDPQNRLMSASLGTPFEQI